MSATEGPSLSPLPATAEPESRGKLKRDAALAVATGFAIQAVLILTGTLVARMLGPDGRGYLAALILWPWVITLFGNLGIPSALTYAIARDPSSSRTLARWGLDFALPQAVLLTALQALWLLVILDGDPDEVRAAGWLTLALVPALLAQQYGLGLLQGHLRLRLFNGLRLLPWALYALGVAVLFAVGEDAIVPIIAALLIAFSISGTICLVSGLRLCRGEGTPAVDRRFLVSFGLRGLGSSFAAVNVFRPDQVVLALFLSPAALGLYVVGLAFTNLPYFIAKSVGLITFPWVASQSEKADARRTMWSLLWLTTGIAVVLVAGLCASAHWLVPFFFGDEFSDALTVTYIVLPGMIFLSARRVLSEGLKGRGYPLAGTIGELLSLAWVAVALAVFVPLWGIYGAAVALSSSYVVSLLVLAGPRRSTRRAGVGRPLAPVLASQLDPGRETIRSPRRGRAPGDRPPGPRVLGWAACELSRPAAVLTLLVASSQGCERDGNRDGPPFEPGNIENRRSLLITDSDIEEAGPVDAIRRRPSLVESAPARRRGGSEAKLRGAHQRPGGEAPDPSLRATLLATHRPRGQNAGQPGDRGRDRANGASHARRAQRGAGGRLPGALRPATELAGWKLLASSYRSYTEGPALPPASRGLTLPPPGVPRQGPAEQLGQARDLGTVDLGQQRARLGIHRRRARLLQQSPSQPAAAGIAEPWPERPCAPCRWRAAPR